MRYQFLHTVFTHDNEGKRYPPPVLVTRVVQGVLVSAAGAATVASLLLSLRLVSLPKLAVSLEDAEQSLDR